MIPCGIVRSPRSQFLCNCIINKNQYTHLPVHIIYYLIYPFIPNTFLPRHSGTGHGSSRSSCDVAAMGLVGCNLHLFALHFVQHESYLRRFPSDLSSSGSERQMQICLHTLSIFNHPLTISSCCTLATFDMLGFAQLHRPEAADCLAHLQGSAPTQLQYTDDDYLHRLGSPPARLRRETTRKMIGSTG